jgi:signal transduction histidine kinase
VNFRALLAADLGFLAVEEALTLLLAQTLFSEVRGLWTAALVVFLVGSFFWTQAVFRLRTPFLILSRRGTREQATAVYRAASRLPIESLWLRVVLVTASMGVLGFYGVQMHGLPARGVAFLLWTAMMLSPLIDALRALLYERAARRFLTQLLSARLPLRFPTLSPSLLQHGYLVDTYQSRLLIVTLALLGVALGYFAIVVIVSLPGLLLFAPDAAPLRELLFWTPPCGIALIAVSVVVFRRHVRPLDRFIMSTRTEADPLGGAACQPPPNLEGPALRVAERLPLRLGIGKLLLWSGAALIEALLAIKFAHAAPRSLALLWFQLVFCLLAVAYAEWPIETAILSPLLPPSPAAQRTRRAVSTRWLLVMAFALPLLLFALLISTALRIAITPAVWPILCALLLLLIALWAWLGRLLSPLRALTRDATQLLRGVQQSTEHPQKNPAAGEDEVAQLRQALYAMNEVLAERLQSTTQAQARLEAEVADRTAELRHRNEELEQALRLLGEAKDALLYAEKMASIGRLIAGIAHEINNPINAVVNTANPLRETLHEIIADAEKPLGRDVPFEVPPLLDMLRVLDRGAHRTLEIVQALANYAQGQGETPNYFDIHRILAEALELVQHPYFLRVQVVRNYRAHSSIRSLGGQILQVFINLFHNAAHAMSLCAAKDPHYAPRLELSTDEDSEKRELRVTVRDNGPGIPEAVLPRIFDPFFTTKDATQGSGLGLSIVHGILERHDGQIRVETAVGQGTCFTVILPIY